MELRKSLRHCKWLLCGAVAMYIAADMTSVRIFSWVGVFATALLFLNLVGLFIHALTPDPYQTHPTHAEETLFPVEGHTRHELSISLFNYIVNIQIFRRKEKVKWN